MPRIEARISEQEKSHWRQFCESKGISETVMLKMMLQQLTSANSSSAPVKSSATKNKKVSIRLTPHQQKTLHQKSQQEGYLNQSHWVLACVLANLFKEPVLTVDEIKALHESSRQLAAIGRNLNQIARVLNIEFRESNKMTKEAIDLLTANINKHKLHVAKLLHKNRHRWDIPIINAEGEHDEK